MAKLTIYFNMQVYFYLQNLGIILKTDSMMKIARERKYIIINLIKKLQLQEDTNFSCTNQEKFVYFWHLGMDLAPGYCDDYAFW